MKNDVIFRRVRHVAALGAKLLSMTAGLFAALAYARAEVDSGEGGHPCLCLGKLKHACTI